MKGDVGMSLHEKERNKKMPTPRHKVTHNPITTLWGDLPLSTPLGLSLPTIPHAALSSYIGFLPYRRCSDTAGCLGSSGIPGRAASVRTKVTTAATAASLTTPALAALLPVLKPPVEGAVVLSSALCQSVQSWRKKSFRSNMLP